MRNLILGAMVAAGMALVGGTGPAHACKTGKAADEMTLEDAKKAYECIGDKLHAGYMKGKKYWIPADVVKDYRNWELVSTAPAAPGWHGERFLVTYVNKTGADAYKKYAEDPVIPAGTWIAKESFSVTKKGKVRRGPLFLMQKVEAGKSPKTMDWYYMMVAPNGRPQAVNVFKACSECHMENFGHQGGLGYPVEEARVQ